MHHRSMKPATSGTVARNTCEGTRVGDTGNVVCDACYDCTQYPPHLTDMLFRLRKQFHICRRAKQGGGRLPPQSGGVPLMIGIIPPQSRTVPLMFARCPHQSGRPSPMIARALHQTGRLQPRSQNVGKPEQIESVPAARKLFVCHW